MISLKQLLKQQKDFAAATAAAKSFADQPAPKADQY
jgi:hypothetical protein